MRMKLKRGDIIEMGHRSIFTKLIHNKKYIVTSLSVRKLPEGNDSLIYWLVEYPEKATDRRLLPYYADMIDPYIGLANPVGIKKVRKISGLDVAKG